MEKEKRLYTIIVCAENTVGMLSQVAGVFTRLRVNIESLSVSAPDSERTQRYTIEALTDNATIEKICAQVEKKVDVFWCQYIEGAIIELNN